MHGRMHVCVGWLVHVIHDHYVHAEPRSNLLVGGGGGGGHVAPCPMRAMRLFYAAACSP